MCKCNPSIRTPFCGKFGCEWPAPKITQSEIDSAGKERPIFIEISAAEYESLKRDKTRLDYLDECRIRLNEYTHSKYRWQLIQNHLVNRLMCGYLHVDLQDAEAYGHESCRQAIDERMKRYGKTRS